MKTQEDIQKRLEKLYSRYLQRYIITSQARKQCNCKWRTESESLNKNSDELPMEQWIAPCKSSTIILAHNDSPVGVCTFGSDIPSEWNGDICDNEFMVKSCKNFTAKVSADEATEEFNDLMQNDEYVIENYKDIAALQWALCSRVKTRKLGIFERIVVFLFGIFGNKTQKCKELPPIKERIW